MPIPHWPQYKCDRPLHKEQRRSGVSQKSAQFCLHRDGIMMRVGIGILLA